MKVRSEELIDKLSELTYQHLKYVEFLSHLSDDDLQRRKNAHSWSVLECIEHLNLYMEFYLPEITEKIEFSKYENMEYFKSGLIGNYFAQLMLPKEKPTRMKTATKMNPKDKNLNRVVLTRFSEYLKRLLFLLQESRNVDLDKTRTKISISQWIHLKLGDTFIFLVNHNTRHIAQVKQILSDQKINN